MSKVKISDIYLKEDESENVTYVSISDDLKFYVGFDKIDAINIRAQPNHVPKGGTRDITFTALNPKGQRLKGVEIEAYCEEVVYE